MRPDTRRQSYFDAIELCACKRGGVHTRLTKAAVELYLQLHKVYEQAPELYLPAVVLKELGISGWQEALGDWGLPKPNVDNLADWLVVVDRWVSQGVGHLDALRAETVEHLLACERTLREASDSGKTLAAPDQVIQELALLYP